MGNPRKNNRSVNWLNRTTKMKLDFLVVGAAKSGTTSLYKTLCQVNELSLFRAKDVHFFDHDDIFSKGENWYWQQFDQAKVDQSNSRNSNKLIYGEVSANYLYSNIALTRISAFATPSVKIILLLRDPLQRLVSEYKHHFRNGLLKEKLHYYLNNPHAESEKTRYMPWHLLVERSLYAKAIQNLYSHFPEQQIKVINSHFFKQKPQECMKDICQFIGAKSFTADAQVIQPVSTNKAFTPHSKRVMSVINQGSALTRSLKKLIPSFKARQYLRALAIKLNTASSSQLDVTETEVEQARKLLTELGAFEFKF